MSIRIKAQDYRLDTDYQKTIKMFTPSSPQASMFQRFGNYPVDYSTGVPQISIPLYTIKVGDFELPISIDYHNSGIRVQDIATPVGLGWMLNAGGCINRTIMGTDDMDDIRFVYNFDFFGRDEVFYKMEEGPWFMSSVYWDAMSSNNGGDTQVDRYSYNFCGNSGAFRYNLRDKQYNTIPYSDIRIEVYDTKSVSVFGGTTTCKAFCFKLTDHDGTEYYFDYPETARGDYTYSAKGHVTSYFLTKILLPNKKDSIEFLYDEGCKYSTQYNVGYKSKGDEYYISSSGMSLSLTKNVPCDYSSTHTTEQAETLLREIRWNGNSMMFEYVSDRPEVLKYTMNKRIHRLTSAAVRNDKGMTIRNVVFGNEGYMGKHPLERRMMLDSIFICGIDKENAEKYKFEYDNGKLPPYYWLNVDTYKSPETDMRCHEDYWGYSNGTTTDSWIPAEFKGSNDADGDRNANPYRNKAGSLTSITYPTGGKTVYDMECNRLEDGTPWGGLRVKSITNYDVEGKTTNKRTYKYEDAIPTVSPFEFSNMFNYFTYHVYSYTTPNNRGTHVGSTYHDVAVSNPCVPLSANYGSPIHYYKVTEYHGTENDNTGYDIYEYETSFTNDISNWNFYDTDEWAQSTVQYYSDWGNFDEGNAKLLLHRKNSYDALGNLQSYLYNNYEDITVDTFRLGTRVQSKTHWIHYNEYGDISNSSVYMDNGDKSNFPNWLEDNFSITDVWAIPSYKRLASTTEYRDGVTTKTTYGYDEDKRTLSPKSKSVSIANNNQAQANSTTTYTYPFESSGAIAQKMTAINMQVPLKTVTSRNGTVVRTDSVAYGTVGNGIQPKEYYTATGSERLEKRLTYSYDSKGRVLSLTTDAGDCTVFVWGNRNDWPIAKIEGKTLQEIRTCIGEGQYLNLFSETPVEYMLYASRDKLQAHNCTMTIYSHETLVGVKSVIHPNNNAEYFDYDSMGRLIRRKENNATREEYQYNYRK